MAPSLQLVVQCGSQTVLPFRLYKERVVRDIAIQFRDAGMFLYFCDFPTKIGTGSHHIFEKCNYVRH